MKKILLISAAVVFLLILQTLPVFIMKPMGSKVLKSEETTLYYQKGDESGAQEIFDILTKKAGEIYSRMNYETSEPIEVFLYKNQKQLAIREAGFVTLTFAPHWYIGDSHNGKILMVSPYAKVKSHTHDSIVNATLHELVHSINYRINKNMSYFWDNGLATYISHQLPDASQYSIEAIPSISDMHTENGLKFGNMGGYAFSYMYIEYLDKTYGWDKVVQFAKGLGSYKDVFGKTEQEIYDDWCRAIKNSKIQLESSKKKSDSDILKIESNKGVINTGVNINTAVNEFDQAINRIMDAGLATGAAATLVYDDEMLFSKGYGYSNKYIYKQVDAKYDGFRIGSVSKTFVAAAALIAAEEGKIDLNQDIGEYLGSDLPELKYPVNMHQLLTHTAGFEEIVTGMAVKNSSDIEPLSVSIKKYCPQQIVKPGTFASYSNYGIALAAYTIEKVTGIDFADYCQQKIFKNLDMNRTTFKHMHNIVIPSKPYLPNGRETLEPYMNIYPEGSAVSTAEDMGKYLIWLLGNKEKIMKNETKALLFKRQYYMADELGGIGYVWNRKIQNGIEYFEKKGETVNFITKAVLYPSLKVGLFLSFNTYVPEQKINAVINQMTNTLLGNELKIDQQAGSTIDIRGTYVNAWSSFNTAEKILRFINPGKLIEVTGSQKTGYSMLGKELVHQGSDSYMTPIGLVKFSIKDGKTLMLTDFSQTYIKTGLFEGKPFTAAVSLLFMISSMIQLILSMIALIRKKKAGGLRFVICIIQVLGIILTAGFLYMGMVSISVLSYARWIRLVSRIVVVSTAAYIILDFMTSSKKTGFRFFSYMYIHGAISLLFCLILLSLNLL